MKHLYLYVLLFNCIGCNYDDQQSSPTIVRGYKPIYDNYENLRKVEVQPAKKLKRPGKIYIKDDVLFVNELGEGIHIFDNRDKANPKPVAYIAIPANQDMAIKGTTLYADNADDLVAIDISNPFQAKVVKRIEKSFPYPYYPPQRGVRFECPDPAKGYVVRWELTELTNPKCSR
jgi:hypothetical protein